VLTGWARCSSPGERPQVRREWKLPKEIVGYVLSQASGAKDEIVRVVSEEVRKFFESEAFRREFLRLLSSMSIEVQAEISLKPSTGARRRAPREGRQREAPRPPPEGCGRGRGRSDELDDEKGRNMKARLIRFAVLIGMALIGSFLFRASPREVTLVYGVKPAQLEKLAVEIDKGGQMIRRAEFPLAGSGGQ